MRQMFIPSLQYASHSGRVAGMPKNRVPIGIDDCRAAARAEHTMQFGQGGLDVGNKFVYLRGNRQIKMIFRIGKLRRFRQMELDVDKSGAALARHRDGTVAIVHRVNRAAGPHGARQLFRDKSRPAADVERAFPGPRRDCFQQHASLGSDFRRTVSHLQMAQRFFVKLHKDNLCRNQNQARKRCRSGAKIPS